MGEPYKGDVAPMLYPLSPGETRAGFSTDGVCLEGSVESVRRLQEWHHAATGRLPAFERLYGELLTDHAALRAQIQAERSRAEGWKRSAEVAEAALLPLATLFDPSGATTVSFSDTIGKWFTMGDLQDAYFAYRAAHPQPQAPVMGGEG